MADSEIALRECQAVVDKLAKKIALSGPEVGEMSVRYGVDCCPLESGRAWTGRPSFKCGGRDVVLDNSGINGEGVQALCQWA